MAEGDKGERHAAMSFMIVATIGSGLLMCLLAWTAGGLRVRLENQG